MPVQIGRKAGDFSVPTGLMSDCHRLAQLDEQHEYAREVDRHLVELLEAI